MDISKFVKSKILVWVVAGFIELAIILGAFRVGMLVGFNKANFSYRWGENYHHLFGGPSRGWFAQGLGFMSQFDKDDFISSHNVVGSIIKISSSAIVVKTANDTEQSLAISPWTIIRKGNADVQVNDLKENDRVVAFGSPSSTGQIEVKFMRIFQR